MDKIITYKSLKKLIKKLEAKTIVLAGGCFDILHSGHLAFLKAAKKQGEILVVALESDENIKCLKGKNRPINKQTIRADHLAKLSFVDYVILLPEFKNDDDYLGLVKIIKPTVIAVTENDPMIDKKKSQAELVGAKVIAVIPYLEEYSTTKIINTNISKLVSRKLEVNKLKTNLSE